MAKNSLLFSVVLN